MTKKSIIISAFLLPLVIYFYPGFFLHEDSPLMCSHEPSEHIFPEKKDSTDILNPVIIFPDGNISWLDLHYNSYVVDSHNDFLWQMYKRDAKFGLRDPGRHTGLIKLLEGGVGLQVFAIWQPAENKNQKDFVIRQVKLLKAQEDNFPKLFEVAYNYQDIIRIQKEKKLAGLTGIEGGNPIEGNPENIREFFKMGIRYIGLTWDNSNDLAVSEFDEEKKNRKGGLTELGKEVVKQMNEVGMLIDVSHLGEKSFFDVMEITKQPVIASHSCSKSINDSYRNLTDEQIKAISAGGGLIMINFNKGYLSGSTGSSNAYEKYSTELEKLYEESQSINDFNNKRAEFLDKRIPQGEVTITNVIKHIKHIKSIAGIDCIGLGSDFDGGIKPPFDLYDATCYPLITKQLVENGFSELEIRKILGLNFLRVFKQVCG